MTSVHNQNGELTVSQNYGMLGVTVTGSQFQSIDISQDGCCPGTVVLHNDVVPGPVFVSLGVANGNDIDLDLDHFGSTVLEEGQGPTMAGCNGTGNLSRSTTRL